MNNSDPMTISPERFSEQELIEHEIDLMSEIAFLAREVASNQKRIALLSDRLELVETEGELRQAKLNGQMN